MLKLLKRLAFGITFAFLALVGVSSLAKTTVQAQTATLNYCGGGGSVHGVKGRKDGKQWFYFNVTGGGANVGTEAFCRNPSAGAAHGLTVTVSKSKSPSYALKALTWYFKGGHRNTEGRRATQAFIWAHGNKSAMATGYSKYWESIAKTVGTGYVLQYNSKKSGMQGWYGYKYEEIVPEYDDVHETDNFKEELKYSLTIVKKSAETGKKIDSGVFKIMFDNNKIGKGTKRKKITKNGRYAVVYTLPFKKTVKSKSYKFCKNWNLLSSAQRKKVAKSVYHDKSSARAAAKAEVKEKKKALKEKIKNGKHTWTVEEIQAPSGSFLLDSPKKTIRASFNDGKQTMTFSDPAATTTVVIHKKAANPSLNVSLKGAVFSIYANAKIKTSDSTYLKVGGKEAVNGTKVATGSTDANGNLTFATKLYPGKYYIKEEAPPAGYLPLGKVHYFTLAQHRTEKPKPLTYTYTLKDEDAEKEISGYISIEKTKGFNKDSESGIKFNIITNQQIKLGSTTYKAGSVVQTLTTGSDGSAKSRLLPEGSYKVKQVNTDADSVKVKSWTVNVSGGYATNYSYTKQDVQLKIKKYMQESGKTAEPEKDAVFQVIKKSDNTVMGTITTDANGVGTYTTKTSGNKELTYGETYILHQTEGDKRYNFADDTTFVLNDSLNTREYAFSFVDTNSCILLKYKVDAITGEKVPEENAEFEISPTGETTGDTITIATNDAGVADLGGLGLAEGTYVIKQTKTEDGYSKTGDITIRVDSAGLIYEGNSQKNTLSITRNDYKEGNVIKIKKTMSDYDGNKTPEAGAEFTIIKASAIGDTNLATLTTAQLRQEYVASLDKEAIIGTITTTDDGSGSLVLDSDVDTFVILQTSGTPGYTLADPVFSTNDSVKVTTNSQGNKIYSFTANDAKESQEKVTVTKQKKDANGNLSFEENAVFQIIDVAIAEQYGLKTADLGSLAKCKKFVATLPSNALLGVLTTDDKGTSETTLYFSSTSQEAVEGDESKDSSTSTTTEEETEEASDSEAEESEEDSDGTFDGNISDNDEIKVDDDGKDESSDENVTPDRGLTYWNATVHPKGFVVIQTDGDVKYKAIEPVYSKDAVSKDSPNANKEGVLVKEETTDAATGMKVTKYSFKATDDLAKTKITFTKLKRTAVNEKGAVTSPEANATFGIYNADDPDGTPVCTFKTNSNGVALSSDLPIGSYVLKQIDGEAGYQKLGDIPVVITEDNIGETINLNKTMSDSVDFIDKETSISLKLYKSSSETGTKLKDALFEIYNKKDVDLAKKEPKEGAQCVRTLYTDSDGYAGCQLPFGEYVIIEKSAPLGYIIDTKFDIFTLDAETTTVDADGNRSYIIKRTNTPIYGEIKGVKKGEVLVGKDSEGNFTYEERGIKGATYSLYAKEDITDDSGKTIWTAGTHISDATSDDNGEFQFTNPKQVSTMSSNKEFWCGKYYFKETSSPYGFTLDSKEYEVVLTWNKSTQNVDTDDAPLDENGYDDGDELYTRGVDHILTTGEKLNPLIKDAKTITFTWKKTPSGSVDVSVSKKDGVTPAGDVWLYNDGKGNITISSCKDNAVINFSAVSSGMFKNCTKLTTIYFDNINTSQVRDMREMFSGCTALTKLDLSSFNFAPVWWTDSMFSGCTKIKTIYSAGLKSGDDGEVTLIPVELSAIPINNFCVEDEKNDNAKFTAADFQFTMKYLRSDGMEQGGVTNIVTVTDNDIKSFNKTGPWSKDMKSVEITFNNPIEGFDAGSITVPIVVNGPEDYDGTLIIDTHPIVTTNVYEDKQIITINTLKVDSSSKKSLDGALIGLYALCDIHDVKGDVIVKKGELIRSAKSNSEFGGVTFTDLPTDAYASEKNKPMYEIKEIAPPPGYTINGNSSYQFGASCEDQTHVEFKHTYTGDKGLIDSNGNKITSDGSAIYHEDCGIFENTESGKLTIMKYWEDYDNLAKKRPDSVTFNIYRGNSSNGTLLETITLSDVNNWTAELNSISKSEVSKMSDSQFKDTFSVEEVVPESYKHSDNTDLVLDRSNGVPVIKAKNIGENRTRASIRKVWKDNDNASNKRPSSVQAQLYCDGVSMGSQYLVTLDDSNNWSGKIENLELYDESTYKEHKYSWKEIYTGNVTGKKDTGYVDSYDVNSDEPTEIILTNTLDTGIHVLKVWDDDDDAAGLRPDEVKVQLYRNGESMGEKYQVTLSDSNNWLGTIDGLPTNDSSGNEYNYTWKEMDAYWLINDNEPWKIGYTATYDEVEYNDMQVTQITNTVHTQGSISVTKELDADDVYFSHGNPTFTFHLKGIDWQGNEVDLEKTVEYTEDDVKNLATTTGVKLKKEAVFTGVEMGTYTITESGTEGLYEFNKLTVEGDNVKISEDGKVATVTLGKDSKESKIYSTGKATYYNTSYRGSIKIVKYEDDEKSKPLKGVTFSITNQDGKEIGTATTDENGEINFTELKRGTYTLKETKTVGGHSLLSKPFTVKIPITLTKDAVKEQKADVTKGKYNKTNDTYDFYDLTYNVINSPLLEVPHTGFIDDLKTYLPLIAAMILIVGVEVFLCVGKNKPKRKGKHSR